MLQNANVPQALHDLAEKLSAKQKSAGLTDTRTRPLGELCFRVLALQSAIRAQGVIDPQEIYDRTMGIDHDAKRMVQGWSYLATLVPLSNETHFQGKSHTYESVWRAEEWNDWRIIRIWLIG